MTRPRRQVLLPAVAFLGLLALAFGAVERARATPKGALYRVLRDYQQAVHAGDGPRIRALAPDLEADALLIHLEPLEGLIGHVERVDVSEDGLEGEAVVTWLDRRGRGRHVEALAWRRRSASTWRLERIAVVR